MIRRSFVTNGNVSDNLQDQNIVFKLTQCLAIVTFRN